MQKQSDDYLNLVKNSVNVEDEELADEINQEILNFRKNSKVVYEDIKLLRSSQRHLPNTRHSLLGSRISL